MHLRQIWAMLTLGNAMLLPDAACQAGNCFVCRVQMAAGTDTAVSDAFQLSIFLQMLIIH